MKYLCKTYLTNCNFFLIILKLLTINKKAMQYTYWKNNIWVNYNTHYPPPFTFILGIYSYARIVSRGNQTTKPWSFSTRTDIHELYILLAKPFEIPNLHAKSLNSKFNFSFINTRSNWSATSSWKENVFSIFNSLTKVKNISFVTQVYNKSRNLSLYCLLPTLYRFQS